MKDYIKYFVGVSLFMLSAGIESTWIIDFFISNGLSESEANITVTIYGFAVLLSSFLAGVFYEKYGLTITVWLAFGSLLFSTLIFLYGSTILHNNYLTIMGYFFRGLAYPLFSYSVFAYLIQNADSKSIGKVTGYFWLAFNLGFTILGPVFSNWYLVTQSMNSLFLSSLSVGLLGTIIVSYKYHEEIRKEERISIYLRKTFKYLRTKRKVQFIVLYKSINNIGQFGLVLIVPFLLTEVGFDREFWSYLWSFSYVINIFAGVIIGIVADRIGLYRAFKYFSGIVSGFGLLIVYILFEYNINQPLILFIAFSIYTIGIAGYGPLAGLIKENINEAGVATSLLNLGSGLSNLLGPLLVSILNPIFGMKKVLMVFGLIYIGAMLFVRNIKNESELKKIEKI